MDWRWLGDRKAIDVFFCAAIVILVSIFIFTYRSTQLLIKAEELRQRSHTELERTQRLISELKDAETGQRGYLITGDKSYLAPYNSAVSEIGATLKDLRDLVGQDKSQQQDLSAVEPLAASKIEELQQT